MSSRCLLRRAITDFSSVKGTASLKQALEILGYAPTLHMFDLWQSAEQSKQWMVACRRIAEGEKVDLRPLVAGYGSGVDTPVSDVFIELAEQFPEAKVGSELFSFGRADLSSQVVLTHRPSADWYKSYVAMSSVLGSSYALWTYWIPEVSRFSVRRIAELISLLSQCYWQRQMSMKGILPLWLSKYGSFGEHMMSSRIEEAKKK